MITETDENYLKETYAFQQDHERVTTSMLAERFGSSAATVTGMLKKLADRNLVEYEPYRGVTLTDAGRAIALEVIRHHRLLETYLVRALGMPWERVHEEAERLEHVLSKYMEERIDDLLGHPTIDPHGSPIPSIDGTVRTRPQLRLSEVTKGSKVEIVEVSDRDSDLLRRLDSLGLHLHTRLTVTDVEPIDGLIIIEVEGTSEIVGRTTGDHVFVKKLPAPQRPGRDDRSPGNA